MATQTGQKINGDKKECGRNGTWTKLTNYPRYLYRVRFNWA